MARFVVSAMKVTMMDDLKYRSNRTEILFLAVYPYTVSTLYSIQRLRTICYVREIHAYVEIDLSQSYKIRKREGEGDL